MEKALYLLHFPKSAKILHLGEIKTTIRTVLEEAVASGVAPDRLTAENCEEKVEALVQAVSVARWEEGHPNGAYYCVGAKFTLNEVHSSLILAGYNGKLPEVTRRLYQAVREIPIGCPAISYVAHLTSLPCGSAGTCGQLVKLAEALEARCRNGDDSLSTRTAFTFQDGELSLISATPESLEEMAIFAQTLREETKGRLPGDLGRRKS